LSWIIENWIESIGYVGSVIVVLSLMMSNILMLRWINLVGGTIFTFYGYLIGAVPVFVLNGVIVLIDIYYLVDIYRAQDTFSLKEIKPSDWFLKKFLEFYQSDILYYFPDFDFKTMENDQFVLVFRNIRPVGIFAYQKKDGGFAKVVLDYISPSYRDYKNAYYLMTTRRHKYALEGISHLQTESSVSKHQKYLKKIGFKQDAKQPTLFNKSL